jgi:hypothetical protein
MININYLSHNRINFSDLTFHFLNKIKDENKTKIKLSILATHDVNWDLSKLEGITVEVKIFNMANNYLPKIMDAISTDCEYSIKLDEDCFISNNTWDYLIENIGILNITNNLLISPVMSNNIPSCDKFIEDFITDETIRNQVYSYFLKRNMPVGLWDTDYSPLNKFTIDADKWDYKAYYEALAELPTTTKGMHPLRITYEAQVLINEYILNNLSLFLNKNHYNLIELKSPYFTNSLFAIKTSEWKNILGYRGVDGYDEIALNNYKRETNKKFLFIDKGFGFHPMYNTVFGNRNRWNIGVENGEELELKFYNDLKNKII